MTTRKKYSIQQIDVKKCRACDVEKHVDDFTQVKDKKDPALRRPGSYCKKCNNQKSNESRKRASYKAKAQTRYQKKKADNQLAGKLIAALNNMRAKVKKRGFACDFTTETLEKWWQKTPDHCAICGLNAIESISLARNIYKYNGYEKQILGFGFSQTQVSSHFLEIDRINSNHGYVEDNVQKVCRCCNSTKGRIESLPLEIVADQTRNVHNLIKKLMDQDPTLFEGRAKDKTHKTIRLPSTAIDLLKEMKVILKTKTYEKTIQELAKLAKASRPRPLGGL